MSGIAAEAEGLGTVLVAEFGTAPVSEEAGHDSCLVEECMMTQAEAAAP